MKLREAVRDAAAKLQRAGVTDPAFEAELLARTAAGVDRARYLAGAEASPHDLALFDAFVTRRERREPAAFITGEREFYGRPFAMGPGALIPRPETEMLVDFALEVLSIDPAAVVADIGTGSGCVAVSIAAERPRAAVVGIDISPEALKVAATNARRHAPWLPLVTGDLATLLGRADVIVANLPYIPAGEIDALEPEVSRWEPRVALDGGSDGFAVIQRLINDCAARLRPRALALEVGYGQATRALQLLRESGAITEVRRDLAGIDRIVVGRWP